MPKYTQHKKTKSYSNEFKTKAVQLSLMDGVQVQAVAQTLDMHPFLLSRWRKEYREGVIVPDNRKTVASLWAVTFPGSMWAIAIFFRRAATTTSTPNR